MIDASFGAFHGSYSAFHRWRYNHLLVAVGGFCYVDGDKKYFYLNDDRWPGLYALMLISDSSGYLLPRQCLTIASEINELMPVITTQKADGQLSDIETVSRKFAQACLVAFEQNKNLFLNKYDDQP